jgi:hypothetical protein
MLQRIIGRGKSAARVFKQKSGHLRAGPFAPPQKFHALVSMRTQNPAANARPAPERGSGGEAFMRRATAALCRQAFLAALAGIVLAGLLSAGSRTPPRRAADAAIDRPILVRSIALGRAPVVSEIKAPVEAPARKLAKAAGIARAQSPLARSACLVPPCQRLAALGPAPPRRPNDAWEPAPIKVAFGAPAAQDERRPRSFSERLLQPVGNLRDRVMGLISSL